MDDFLGKIITGIITGIVTLAVCCINNAVQLKRDRAALEQSRSAELEALKDDMVRQINDIKTDFMTHFEELIATQQDINNKVSLFSYQLDELSKRVEKHNNVIERTYKLEQDMEVEKEHYAMTNKRLIKLEDKS